MSVNGLNILVVNWQDAANPQAGGAEVHLHEIFGRLVKRGHRVTLLCSGWPGAAPRDEVDGIRVHRVGGRHSFTFLAMPYYRRHLWDAGFDLIVEDINKIPLYCPLWVRAPVVALVPHLFGATAFREASLPFAAAVWLAERPVPHFYATAPFQAISDSTASDLVERGVPEANIRVIHPGIDRNRYQPDASVTPFAEPTFVYVGRLKRYKGLEVVIEALAQLYVLGVPARLIIAGKGDHEANLRNYAESRAPGLVEFRGFVSEDDKLTLLRKGWATVYPSPKEGWGLANVEAAACGTPALASDSPGLRESVEDGGSGLLVRHGDVAAWVRALRRVVEDSELRRRLREGARRFAGAFSWDRTADETETHLRDVHQGSEQSRTHHTTSTSMSEAT